MFTAIYFMSYIFVTLNSTVGSFGRFYKFGAGVGYLFGWFVMTYNMTAVTLTIRSCVVCGRLPSVDIPSHAIYVNKAV